MGTDLFLIWEGQSLSEVYQRTEHYYFHSLKAGHLGYLRTTVHMKLEISVLKIIFPDNPYWNRRDPGCGIKFSFIDNNCKKKIEKAISFYKEGLSNNMSILNKEDQNDWLNSLESFAKLGEKLNQENKETFIDIDW